MTLRDLTAVLLAVLGIYLLGTSIAEAANLVFFLNLDSPDEFTREMHFNQALVTGFYVVARVSFAIIVVAFRSRIAAAIAPTNSEAIVESNASHVQAALFAVLGVYFFVEGVAVLGRGVAELQPHESLTAIWPSFASTMIETGLGLALFFGSRGLSNAWDSARAAGRVR